MKKLGNNTRKEKLYMIYIRVRLSYGNIWSYMIDITL